MKIIGHRGARGLAPENTLASLHKGLQHHVDMLEFDVRVTRDGVPVLHHDSRMLGVDGKKFAIRDHSYDELKAHFPDIAKLSEALDLIDAKAMVYIEVKQKEPIPPIVKVLEGFIGGMYSANDMRLGSKSQKTLLELHRALPGIEKIVIEPWSGVRATRRARQIGAKTIAMNQAWLWWGFIRAISRNYELLAYPLNNPAKARRWAKYGLAGAITDCPDRFEP